MSNNIDVLINLHNKDLAAQREHARLIQEDDETRDFYWWHVRCPIATEYEEQKKKLTYEDKKQISEHIQELKAKIDIIEKSNKQSEQAAFQANSQRSTKTHQLSSEYVDLADESLDEITHKKAMKRYKFKKNIALLLTILSFMFIFYHIISKAGISITNEITFWLMVPFIITCIVFTTIPFTEWYAIRILFYSGAFIQKFSLIMAIVSPILFLCFLIIIKVRIATKISVLLVLALVILCIICFIFHFRNKSNYSEQKERYKNARNDRLEKRERIYKELQEAKAKPIKVASKKSSEHLRNELQMYQNFLR